MKISIVVPLYNEERTIKKCVERVLVAKILNMNLEVIISDNNSIQWYSEIPLDVMGSLLYPTSSGDINPGDTENLTIELTNSGGLLATEITAMPILS